MREASLSPGTAHRAAASAQRDRKPLGVHVAMEPPAASGGGPREKFVITASESGCEGPNDS
eukprot:3941357-Rhodomonas_salina.4